MALTELSELQAKRKMLQELKKDIKTIPLKASASESLAIALAGIDARVNYIDNELKKRANRQKTGARNKQKGKEGEREVAALFRRYGFDAQRGVQYQGGHGSADVKTALDEWLHVEVKRGRSLAPYDALEQAAEDAGLEQTPAVFYRRDGEEWLTVMKSSDFMGLLRQLKKST